MSEQAVLSVNNLSVNFGGVRAVDGVSFDVARGSILGLVGPNGAGKTTLFDALCGFVPSRGRIELDGVEISDKRPEARSRARLGRSFQDARLFPSLTVFETLCVAYERHARPPGVISTALSMPWVRRTERKIVRRADEMIERMGLGAFRDKFISELSTGSRRIVDLAVSLIHEPLVLLLDEPSSGIAQREAEALGPLLLQLREQSGVTMLVIEHDMPLIMSISDRMLALETGAVLIEGTPDEVLHDPRLVSAYLGTNQAVVERSGARTRTVLARNASPVKKASPAENASPGKKVPVKKVPGKKVPTTSTGLVKKVAGVKKAPAATRAARPKKTDG